MRRWFTKSRGAAVLAALAVATSLSVVQAGSAEAAVSCSGTITWHQTYSYDGRVAGELVIYYNSTNGGTNSACFYHREWRPAGWCATGPVTGVA